MLRNMTFEALVVKVCAVDALATPQCRYERVTRRNDCSKAPPWTTAANVTTSESLSPPLGHLDGVFA